MFDRVLFLLVLALAAACSAMGLMLLASSGVGAAGTWIMFAFMAWALVALRLYMAYLAMRHNRMN